MPIHIQKPSLQVGGSGWLAHSLARSLRAQKTMSSWCHAILVFGVVAIAQDPTTVEIAQGVHMPRINLG
jgi:hypothetical protein